MARKTTRKPNEKKLSREVQLRYVGHKKDLIFKPEPVGYLGNNWQNRYPANQKHDIQTD